MWLSEYVPNAVHFKQRLDETTDDQFLKEFGKADYLFAGHEYFDKKKQTDSFFKVANKLASYVLHPYEFGPESVFDGQRAFLFCYSEEMRKKYAEQKPIQLFLYHSGVGEVAYLTANPKPYLVWMGRLDAQKAPHYAILAAEILGKEIKVLGKSVYDAEYSEKYKTILEKPHVKLCGVVFGDEKMKLLSEAECALYTCSKEYCEAGAGTLGEILCSGVPLAGMTWKGDDAVSEAVSIPLLGSVAHVHEGMTDDEIARALASSVKECLGLDRSRIYQIAHEQYDMERLMRQMMKTMDGAIPTSFITSPSPR
jgi:glycosyltransferase involved in cell wall biosynthesis